MSRHYSDIQALPDERPERKVGQTYGPEMQSVYDSMIDIITNHKMELQKIPQCSAQATASLWAAKRGLRAREEDLNGDGIPEVVVYNKAGQPMIINGYKPRLNDYAIRNRYWSEHPSQESRVRAGPMKQWARNRAYEVNITNPEKPWNRSVQRTKWGDQLARSGYRMPAAPKKMTSIFGFFCKLIAPVVQKYFDSGAAVTLLGEDAGEACVKVLKKVVSPISMYRMLFMKCVERWYFYELYSMRPSPLKSKDYAGFKDYVKHNPDKFWTFFANNLLGDDKLHWKENIINVDVVARLFVKDEIDWDGSDPDDAIVFLLGLKNLRDHNFTNVLQNAPTAAAWLSILNNKNIQNNSSKIELLKWKERSRESTKQFFKKLQQDLFENEAAYDRFVQRRNAGQNPIDPSEEADEAAPTVIPGQREATALPSRENSEDEEE